MPLITIREKTQPDDNSYEAELSFDNDIPYQITLTDPFSQKQENALEWYFEEYLRFPFIKQVEFKAVAETLPVYGQSLFNQVFVDNDAYADYRAARQSDDLAIEIVGSPTFHRWHWEALKDPRNPEPLAMRGVFTRKPLERVPPPVKMPPSPTLNVLLVVARPDGKNDVGYRTISQPLVEAVQNAKLPVKIDILRPGTYRALVEHLENTTAQRGKGYYHLIHFDVHGAVLDYDTLQKGPQMGSFLYQARYGRDDLKKFDGHKAFLFLTSEKENQSDFVEASELADLLAHHGISIVALNACQSAKQVGTDTETSLGSRLMQTGAQTVLAMAYSVTVSAAKLFMQTLYAKLFEQHTFATAIRLARLELHNDKTRKAYFNQHIDLEDWLLPVVYQRQTVSLPLREFTDDENKVYWEAPRYEPPETQYGFVGRDLDVLEIENRLLSQRNLLLIQGMGGAGKTTLLHHLGAWWQTTHFVEKVFYFGYDDKAWTRQQVMAVIAQQLWDESDYKVRFQPLPEIAQQKKLVQRLRAERHLLILDNLESITGAHLAIQHTLEQDEQQNLHSLLKDLVGGNSLILLGSRGAEAWLAKGTFGNNVYSLSGLDSEAASQLANKILDYHQVSHYRSDEKHRDDLRKLLKLLDGYPLALEVVLANLAQQSPKEVLSALEAGDENIDFSSEKKTESILRCIDYSYGNLSEETQKLLLCLAPFSGVIDIQLLPQYTKKLELQPVLADLPFERWESVLEATTNWGLLSQHPDLPYYRRLQPIFPYFLRNRLQSQFGYQEAIEIAFRQHYEVIGGALLNLLYSKKADQKQIWQKLMSFEYENLSKALDLALAAQVSIFFIYRTLSSYLETTQDHARTLALSEWVLAHLEKYPAEMLQGQLGAEFVSVMDNIADQQLELKQYTQAANSYQKALSQHLNLTTFEKKDINSANFYHQLGIVAQEQQQWQAAEQYLKKALSIDIEFNDKLGQAMTYHNLGKVTQEQQQWQNAEQYYQNALTMFIEFNDKHSLAATYHNLGIVAQKQQQWQNAEQYYQNALTMFIEFNDKYSLANTYHQLGRVTEEQWQWQAAEQYYQNALAIFIKFDSRYEQAKTYGQLGSLAIKQKQWQQAKNYLLKTLNLFVEFNDSHTIGMALRNLARLHQATNDDTIPAEVAKILDISVENATERLAREILLWTPINEKKLRLDYLKIISFVAVGSVLGLIGYLSAGFLGSLIGGVCGVGLALMGSSLFGGSQKR